MTLLIKDGWWAVLRNLRVVGPLKVEARTALAGAPGFASGEWYTEATQVGGRKAGMRGQYETDLDIIFTAETEKEAVLFVDAMNRQTDPDRRRAVAELPEFVSGWALPDEIKVWGQSAHTGVWSTTRYPEEAVAFVPKSFNGLTPAEAERLAMLAEECAEVVQIVGKILRHGYKSFHPNDPKQTPNRKLLEKEVLDVLATHLAMIRSGDVKSPGALEQAASDRWHRKLAYTHHQEGGPR